MSNSGLVTTFQNNDFNYSIFRPSTWVAQAIDPELREMVMLPDSETGEFVSITVGNNDQSLSLEQVGEELVNSGLVNELLGFSLGKEQSLLALRSLDGFDVVFVNQDYVYLISYDVSEISTVNFATTFEMMLNSFKLING